MILLIGTECGCGSAVDHGRNVPLAQVPAPVKSVGSQALPGIKIESAVKLTVKGREVYKLRGKDKSGKIRETQVSASGALLSVD